jgi:hypothetical protein
VQGTHWLKVDFLGPRTERAVGVAGYSHPTLVCCNPSTTWYLEGSNDDSTWAPLWSAPTGVGTWSAGAMQTYPPTIQHTVTTPGAYRYYRIISSAWNHGSGYALVCNWAMYALDDTISPPVDIMSPGYPVYADSHDPSWGGGPQLVANKEISTPTTSPNQCWESVAVQGTHWLKVDFLGPREIVAFGVAGYSHATSFCCHPTTTWYLEGSNDDSTWTQLWSAPDGSNSWTLGDAPSYPPAHVNTVTTPGAYRYYRIISSAWDHASGYALVCNWAMYETKGW